MLTKPSNEYFVSRQSKDTIITTSNLQDTLEIEILKEGVGQIKAMLLKELDTKSKFIEKAWHNPAYTQNPILFKRCQAEETHIRNVIAYINIVEDLANAQANELQSLRTLLSSTRRKLDFFVKETEDYQNTNYQLVLDKNGEHRADIK